MASSSEDNECKGIFGTCISTAGMIFVLIAIIIASALVLALPITHCIIKNQRLEKANRLRIEAIQLQRRQRIEGPDGIHDINGNGPVHGFANGPLRPNVPLPSPVPANERESPDAAGPAPDTAGANSLAQNPVELNLEAGMTVGRDFAYHG